MLNTLKTDTGWHDATPAQQGIWVLDKDERLRPTYLVPSVLEFTGTVDHSLLVESVRRAVSRHPALRSRFRLDPRHRRVQYRTDGAPAEVGFIDAIDEGWSPQEVARLIEVLCWTPFDLADEAPARAEVIRVEPETTLLVLTMHHIAFDGWSRHLLVAEITAIYQAAVRGQVLPLAAAGHPADVLGAAQQDGLAERTRQVVQRLRGAPLEIELPYDRRPGAGESSLLGSSVAVRLDDELTGKVMAVASQEGCTPFMTAIALLAGTLARAGSQRDFLFAFGWPGREDPASADVIGMFMATLVLRVGLDGDTTWRGLLRAARQAATAAFIDSDVPLNAVAAALNPDRQVLWPPLTPVLVNVDDLPLEIELAPGVRGRYRPIEPIYTKYDLDLFVRLDQGPDGNRLELSIDYSPDLFDRATITDLLSALRRSAADLAYFTEEPVLRPPTADANLDDPAARIMLVREAWREVLNVDEVDDDATFFDTGGDSLSLIVLVERLNQLTGRALKTIDLFRAGTVRGQAELLAGPATAAPASTRGGRDRLLNAARNGVRQQG
jgi:acyl carrier protein